jgi:N-acetylglutamate synthase-like GNAT family acetyltransferase
MQIAQATKSDIPQLLALVHLCYRAEDSLKGWTTERGLIDGNRTTETSLSKMLDEMVILKLTEHGTIIGCAYAERVDEATMATGR